MHHFLNAEACCRERCDVSRYEQSLIHDIAPSATFACAPPSDPRLSVATGLREVVTLGGCPAGAPPCLSSQPFFSSVQMTSFRVLSILAKLFEASRPSATCL
mmetsp:Transcript_878/g.1523  ORF Transcript_878/g.1523 Transcript_878/m.1523 type:complete len:102 (-) Transcript_878:19-324(-)